ncbi:MAG: LytTR family DNA-binding domain-containing protein [Christiangramia sp.]|nr:LytTR family DNA-binding domain-containing protein [Christiangramia sp.]
MNYNCIIVDDEPPAIKVLESYIESVPQLNIVKSCPNAFEALNVLNSEKIDLMFLDIQMPKLMGTEMIKTLPYPPKVIFTTAHKDFALEAFDLDAIDYLLKPVSFDRFLKAVNKFCHHIHEETDNFIQAPGFVYFRADRKMVKVLLDDILYIESLKDYIVIHRKDNPDLRIKQTLTSVEKMLPQNLFIRIHRSFIVSIDKVTAYTKNDIEIGRIELPVGRNHSEVFKKLSPLNFGSQEDPE